MNIILLLIVLWVATGVFTAGYHTYSFMRAAEEDRLPFWTWVRVELGSSPREYMKDFLQGVLYGPITALYYVSTWIFILIVCVISGEEIKK
jgi:4-hydroxybenzoate polyprenyltransferase